MPDPHAAGHGRDEQTAGLWAERTALAWQRSALALAVIAALLLHSGGAVGTVSGALVAACSAVAFAAGRHPHARPRLIRALFVLTLLTALAAALAVASRP